MFCPNCGKENNNGSIFCEDCGTKLEQSSNDIEFMQEIEEDNSIEKLEEINEINNDFEEIQEINENINLQQKQVNEIQNEQKSRKKLNIKIIFILIIIILAILVAAYFMFFRKNDDSETNSDKDNSNQELENKSLTYAEFKEIIEEYAIEFEKTVNEYIQKNDDIPEYDQIKLDINYKKYDISCDRISINSDGTVYLTKCSIVEDDSTEDKLNYEHGTIKDNIIQYIYKGYYNDSSNLAGYYASKTELVNGSNNLRYELLGTYKCLSDKCEVYSTSMDENSNTVIIYDNKNYLYNYVNQKKTIINLENKKYISIMFDKTLKGYLIDMRDNQLSLNYVYNYYDLTKGKMIFNKEYNFIMSFDGNYMIVETKESNDKYRIDYIDYQNLKVINSKESIVPLSYYQYKKLDIKEKDIYEQYIYTDNSYTLLNSSFDNLISDIKFEYYSINSDNTVTINDKNKFYIYDLSGNKKFTSKEYSEIIKPVEDYVIVNDKNEIKILDKSEKEIVTLFNNSKEELDIYSIYSGRNEEKIYVKCLNRNIPEGTLGNGVEYVYYLTTKKIEILQDEYGAAYGKAKPVLYLYPTKTTKVTVGFEHPELLTTTYPKYKNIWNVTAKPNGDLYDSNKKYYYGLYWEESYGLPVNFNEGFYVTKENAIEFLEEKLTIIGLNNKERNEFIMYWLPILEKNDKNLIYFELTEERESFNKLIINPKPDSLLRIAIHVKKVDNYVNIKEQKLEPFNRVGFAAIEWGGVSYN